jgi:hypothetical protein
MRVTADLGGCEALGIHDLEIGGHVDVECEHEDLERRGDRVDVEPLACPGKDARDDALADKWIAERGECDVGRMRKLQKRFDDLARGGSLRKSQIVEGHRRYAVCCKHTDRRTSRTGNHDLVSCEEPGNRPGVERATRTTLEPDDRDRPHAASLPQPPSAVTRWSRA